jgi:homoserine dehydrogenase
MSDNIKIALLGLGDIGEDFSENFLEVIQEGGRPIEIVAVAHKDKNSAVALGFQQNGVAFFENAVDVVKMGEEVDIIFDLTGSAETRQALRRGMQESNNHHTVIAPEIMAKLLWMFFGTDNNIAGGKGGGY